jgi:hypothetical protein
MAYPYYDYEIGTTSNRDNLEDVIDVVPSPDSKTPHYVVFRDTGSGPEVADGFEQCTWHFDFLSETDFNTLMGYVTGQSSTVHIRTKKDDATFACYACIMHRPKVPGEAKRMLGKGWSDVTVRFSQLVSEAC